MNPHFSSRDRCPGCGGNRARGTIRVAVANGWRIWTALAYFYRELAAPRLGRLNPIAPLEHLNCFTTRSLLSVAARCGLARVAWSWRVLRQAWIFPAGWRGFLKQAMLPWYLRSRWSTQLWFTDATRTSP